MSKHKVKTLFIVVFLLSIVFIYLSINNAQKNSDKEKYNILKNAINKSAVQCYAIEGFYPPNIEYIEDNYGLIVDYNKYVVSYNVFASNIIPEVEVFIK